MIVLRACLPMKKAPDAAKRKGGFLLTSLADVFNVARNPATNHHIGRLSPRACRVNTVTQV
jgi:hypothetical protein